MIITKDNWNQKVPKDMIPTRVDSALNLYTNIHYKNESGILVYNTNPDTWNCLYSFYELNHKFTMDHYQFANEEPTYIELIKEYESIYHKIYEQEKGYTKKVRMNILVEEYKKTFNLDTVQIGEELEPIFELKYSKSKNTWTLYYFENYVASKVSDISVLLNQNLYEQKVLTLDGPITNIDGIDLASNIPYLISNKTNIKKLNDHLMESGE